MSFVLFILVKFYWDHLVLFVSSESVDTNSSDENAGYFSMMKSYYKGIRDEQNFAMSIDIDDFKVIIFINTVIMKNFKILKKLDGIMMIDG